MKIESHPLSFLPKNRILYMHLRIQAGKKYPSLPGSRLMPYERFRHGAAIDGGQISLNMLPIMIKRQGHCTLSESNLKAKWF
jgi:hypothetical protein